MANLVAFYAFIYLAELPKPYGFSLNVLETARALLPAVVAMFIGGILAGAGISKVGPKPVIFAGSVLMTLGFILFLVNRVTVLDLQIDAAISLGGMLPSFVSVINMISVALPGNFIAIGQSVNNTFKSVGNSVGPVLVTTIMAQYTVANTNLPSRTAFDCMFLLSIVTSLMIIAITLFISNYRLAQPQENLELSGSQ
jgi:MFS family permease